MILGFNPWATPHAYINRRWGNPAGTQHSPMLRQKAVYMRTLPGLVDCGKAAPFGLVPGMLKAVLDGNYYYYYTI